MFLYSVGELKNNYFEFNKKKLYVDRQTGLRGPGLAQVFSDHDLNRQSTEKVGWLPFSSIVDGVNNDEYKYGDVHMRIIQCYSKKGILVTQSST